VLALLAGLLYTAHRRAEADVVLVVDGGLFEVTTRAPTVGSLLQEQGVELEPSDLVVPDAASHLADGSNVTVQRARPAVVVADGESHHLRTHGRSAEDVLDAAGVTLSDIDRLYVNGEPWPQSSVEEERGAFDTRVASIGNVALPRTPLVHAETPPVAAGTGLLPGDPQSWELEVYRAVPITLVEDGLPIQLRVAGPNIAAALEAAGIPGHEQDGFTPPPDSPLEPGLSVALRRATPFLLEVDGEHLEERALASTIGEALQLTGHPLSGRDYSIPAATEVLAPGSAVRIIRVTEDIEVAQVPIRYAVEKVADAGMALDQTRVDRAGVDGTKTVKTRVVFENGTEVGREILEEIVDVAPVSEVVAYGTNVVWNTIDTPEGPKRYWRKMRVYATSYSLSRSGTPKSSPWYGRTRLGWQMRRGVVSVDPRVVPMSSWLFVDGYGIGQAGDTGGGVKGYKIDLGYDDDNYESWHQYVDLYLLEPFPADFDMVWILP
jgi:uncharacterized protein YabE (DUF348 family)